VRPSGEHQKDNDVGQKAKSKKKQKKNVKMYPAFGTIPSTITHGKLGAGSIVFLSPFCAPDLSSFGSHYCTLKNASSFLLNPLATDDHSRLNPSLVAQRFHRAASADWNFRACPD
jgi:hypothetical protein